MLRRCLAAGLLLSPLLLSPAEARAPSARLTGTVTGPDRAVLPGVVVTITNTATGSSTSVVTAAHGTYHALDLAPGTYTVRADLPGFEPQARELVVAEAREIRVDFVLTLASYQEHISIVGSVAVDRLEVTDRGETGARDVGEALTRIGGVSLVRKGGIANDVVVGPYQGENLTVLIDGVRLHGACPNNMDPPAAHADLSEVARIEVGKGPFDVTNQGSLGGVVNIVTARPARGLHGEADLSLGSAGFVNPSATVSYGGARAAVLAGYSFRSGLPYRDGSGDRFTRYANYEPAVHETRAFDAATGWGRLYLRPRQHDSVHLSYTRQHLDHVLYPYLLMDGIWDVAERASLGYEIAQGGWLDAGSVTAYVSKVRHLMTDEYRVSSAGTAGFSMGTLAAARTAGARVQVSRGNAIAGGELYRRFWDAATRFSRAGYVPQFALPGVAQITGGLYVQVTKPIGAVAIEAGARIDRTSGEADAAKANLALFQAYHQTRSTGRADTYASGTLRVSRTIGPLRLTASAGTTARPPDPQERYYALARQGTDWVGNPELPPVRNTGVRVDAAYRRQRLLLDGAVEYDFVKNFITPYAQARQMAVAGVTNTAARSFADVDARLATVELKGSYSLGDMWSLRATAFHTRGTKQADPSRGILARNLPEMPPLRTDLLLRHDRGRWFGEAGWTLAGRQSRVDADLAERPTPANGMLNLRGGVRLGRVRASVSLQNALDRWYYEHLSFQRDPFRSGVAVREPGRTVHSTFVLTW